jgi:competence protein ComEA
MVELLRPPPPRSPRQRGRELVDAVRARLTERGPRDAWRAAAVVGGALGALVAGWWLLKPSPLPVEATLPLASAATAPASAAVVSGPTATVVVQAAGAVERPGVYRLAAGARVVDLLDVAGPLPEADPHQLALASLLSDGQRVWVPRVGEVLPAASATPVPVASGPLDVNRATADELDGLPGVGPALAAAIVGHRERHGAFATVEGLLEVPGIGPAKLEAFRDLVRT